MAEDINACLQIKATVFQKPAAHREWSYCQAVPSATNKERFQPLVSIPARALRSVCFSLGKIPVLPGKLRQRFHQWPEPLQG